MGLLQQGAGDGAGDSQVTKKIGAQIRTDEYPIDFDLLCGICGKKGLELNVSSTD